MHIEWTKSIQIDTFFGYLDVLNVNFVRLVGVRNSSSLRLLTMVLTFKTSRYPKKVLICIDFVHSMCL